MLDLWSPLDAVRKPGRHGAAAQPPGAHDATGPAAPVTLGERSLLGLWQLAGWSGFETAALPVLGEMGFADAGDYRCARRSGAATLWRVGPDRLWIEAPQLPADATSAPERLVALDLSHSRTVITLEGPRVRDLLAMMCPVDLAEESCPAGQFVQTALAQTAVLLHCHAPERFDVIVPITWAASLWEAICHNAAPLGYAVLDPRP